MKEFIYLDYAATTPIDDRVLEVMLRYMGVDGLFANPASWLYSKGREAAKAVELARAQVAGAIGADSEEIVWTSGATEANNLAILGAVGFYENRGKHIVSSAIEHSSVFEPLEHLARNGYEICLIKPNSKGVIDPAEVIGALRPDTVLVSVMHANNESGGVQDIARIGQETRKRGVLLHSDAVQSPGKLVVDVNEMNVDLLSLSAHKQYGPKGIGALYVRRKPRVMLEPLQFGGGQEGGLRSGTLPVQQIVGMGEALHIVTSDRVEEVARLTELRDRLWAALKAIPGMLNHSFNGLSSPSENLCNLLYVSIPGWPADKLMREIPQLGLSSGAACGSSSSGPSQVLLARGLSAKQATGAVRFSLGRFTTMEEVDRAAELVTMTVIGSDSH